MNFGKKQMIIGAAVLVGGYLLYKKFYAKPAAPATGDATTSTPPSDTATPSDADAASTEEEATDAVAENVESFMGRGKRKKNPNFKPTGNRKERMAKVYLRLLKRGLDPTGAYAEIAKRIKANKSSQQNQQAAMAELQEVVYTPKEVLNEVKEARTVGGGDGFLSQSFMM
jgi:hypothetical protein